MNKTRFDMEQEILDCWKITDDLKMLLEGIVEKDIPRDEIANIVLGLEQLYNLKFSRLFSTFEELNGVKRSEWLIMSTNRIKLEKKKDNKV